MSPVGALAAAYAGCRTRITGLTRHIDDATAARAVPACPRWSVHDVVAHLAGTVDDALNGRMDGMPGETWTAAQVDARRDVGVGEMVAAWNAMAPPFEELLDGIGRLGHQAIGDVVTHEHDIRGALDAPGARDSESVAIGFEFVARGFVDSAAARGFTIAVRTVDGRLIGDEGASTVVTGDVFELMRAMTGRRSEAQLRALEWEGGGPAVAAFTWGPFRPAAEAVAE